MAVYRCSTGPEAAVARCDQSDRRLWSTLPPPLSAEWSAVSASDTTSTTTCKLFVTTSTTICQLHLSQQAQQSVNCACPKHNYLFRPYLLSTCTVQTLPLHLPDPTSLSTSTVQTSPVLFRPYLYCSDPTSSSSCGWLRSASGPTSGTELHAALFSPSLTLTLRRNPRRLCSGAWVSKTIVAHHSVTCCFSNTAFSNMLFL